MNEFILKNMFTVPPGLLGVNSLRYSTLTATTDLQELRTLEEQRLDRDAEALRVEIGGFESGARERGGV